MNAETLRFIDNHLDSDVRELALRKTDARVDLKFALTQIEARQLLFKKVPSWARNSALVFPRRLPLEQCSSEAAAVYKSGLLGGAVLADLTGGLGIDCFFMSKSFERTHYVEPDSGLCACAEHNFAALEAGIKVHNSTAESFLGTMEPCSAIYLDPSRRDRQGNKTVSIADCQPDVAVLKDRLLEKADTVLVKLSPMLDIKKALADLVNVSQVHVVSVGNECKEVLFVMQKGFSGTPAVVCADKWGDMPFRVFASDFVTEHDCAVGMADTIDKYLYEPDSSILKAGLFRSVAAYYGIDKLHVNSHLYTSDKLIADFCGRVFEVVAFAEFGKRTQKELLQNVTAASVAVRNFPLTANELRKRLNLKESSEKFVFGTTLKGDRKVVVLCVKAGGAAAVQG